MLRQAVIHWGFSCHPFCEIWIILV